MPSLPLYLPVGFIMVYGMGTTTSVNGVQVPNPQSPLRFGTVYQVWEGGRVFVYEGDSVMFKNDDGVRLVFDNIPYTIIPARFITKESPPV